MSEEFSTPMMQQYLEIKKQYPECILFFRLGDFYEMFLGDAKIGAEVLGITLTSRSKGKDGKVAMAGVPYHAAEGYIAKLTNKGYRVAIAEQVSDPKAPGLVKREVVRVVSRGTMLSGEDAGKKAQYIVSLAVGANLYGMAMVDAATGEFGYLQKPLGEGNKGLTAELSAMNPVECIVPSKVYENTDMLSFIRSSSGTNIFMFRGWETSVKKNIGMIEKSLSKPLAVWEMEAERDKLAIEAVANLLAYLEYTQKRTAVQVTKIGRYGNEQVMRLDRSTMINLEIFGSSYENDNKNTLLGVLDETRTAMGGRLLQNWLANPLIDEEMIKRRQDAVGRLLGNLKVCNDLRDILDRVRDSERMATRLLTGWGNGRDLAGIRESLRSGLEVLGITGRMDGLPGEWSGRVRKEVLAKVVRELDRMLVDDPGVELRSGGLIRDGIDQALDELRMIKKGGSEWLTGFEKQERLRSGISSLKVKFNRVFGFYIEISRANLNSVPSDYERKQTLVNAERFITPELKEHEVKVLEADARIGEIEYRIYEQLVLLIEVNLEAIQEFGRTMGMIDVICNLAWVASRNRYVKPELVSKKQLKIKNGRHPVVEKLRPGQFVPNDVELDQVTTLVVLTGPNMAGKSVYLRQVAALVLMAQLGSYVPVESMEWSVVDRVFVRSGASDAMGKGLSTFMVEMIETSSILANATSRSLIVMDEIGRGTSTFDGISLAWAIGEFLVSDKWKEGGPLTLFATHYHEMQQLEVEFKSIVNYQAAVVDDKGTPVFLHKIVKGGASHSYGVAVGKLAGLPGEVIKRAGEVLLKLEGKGQTGLEKRTMTVQLAFGVEDKKHPVEEALARVDVNKMTPIEALNWIAEMKEKLAE